MPKYYPELDKQKFHIVVSQSENIALHGHDFLEFSYIAKGKILHETDTNRETVAQGSYFIVDYGTCHAYTGKDIEVINVLFYPEFLERTLAENKSFEAVVNSYLVRFRYRMLKSSPTGKAFCDEDGKIAALLQEMIREYTNQEAGYLEYIRTLLVEMMILTMRKIGQKEAETQKGGTVAAICSSVNKHFAQKLCLSDFAKEYHYSLPHLSRKFAEETGMGFTAYLQKVRIEQSLRLLETTEESVAQIAARVGYNDVRFFNHIFKETLHLTPRAFRKMYR